MCAIRFYTSRKSYLFAFIGLIYFPFACCQDVLACGGFVKSDIQVDFSLIEVKLYTKQGSLKYQTDCAPNNGYYLIPVYDKGDYVVKVEPPAGWQFEPSSVSLSVDGRTDMCSQSKDINFYFKGFSIYGQVLSRGLLEGPPDIDIHLSSVSDPATPIQKTVTQASGSFHFSNISPGDFVVSAVHPHLQFDSKVAKVQVSKDNGKVGENLVVSGYEVAGRVFGDDDEGVRGVQFVLFGNKDPHLAPRQCKPGLPPGYDSKAVPETASFVPLCHVNSLDDGFFRFPVVASGHYTVVPFYKSQNIKFDVVPTKVDLHVAHDSVSLREPFKVEGFSVSGRILTSVNGRGLVGATVYLNEKLLATTTKDGIFQLENMQAGTYDVQVVADQYQFAATPVKISPNTPNLPDIIASAFEVCGTLEGDDLVKSTQFHVSFKSTQDAKRVLSSVGGQFCVWLTPGSYEASIVDIRDEAIAFKPNLLKVVVKDAPVSNLAFQQFKARVEGTVRCLVDCDKKLQIILKPLETTAQTMKQQVATVTGGNFVFGDVLPGKYEIMTSDESWCWEEASFRISIQNEDLKNIVFNHKGFLLTVISTHATTLQYQISGAEKKSSKPKNASKNSGEFKIVQGTNKMCLEAPGLYVLKPVGCHIFASEQYAFDTASPSALSIEATRHLLSGMILSEANVSDVKIAIRTMEETPAMQNSNGNNGEKSVLGPLPAKHRAKQGDFEYLFTYWAAPHTTLELKPLSDELLFYPDIKTITTLNDCMENNVNFVGQKGLFLEGHIDPPLAGVRITVTAADGSMTPVTLETPKNGRFRVGPLHGHTKYEVQAEKQGYVLTPGKSMGHFTAYKLAEIRVSVIEDGSESQPLSGVILSLSGGAEYRKNNFTQEDGKMLFAGLGPGQYYLRAMMKEFQFDPPSRMVEVSEGSSVNVILKGRRVSFSCFGTVTTLTGDPEVGLVVEAVGRSECSELQEEVTTESDGRFRLRGLKPKCNYEIRLKRSPDVNRHIERSAPKSHVVRINDGDVSAIHLIAFRPLKTMDISGNVVSSSEYLPALKIHLTSENGTDQTYALGHSNFFQFLSLPMDGGQYTLALESSLSRSAYQYTLPAEVTFRGNCSYRHFTFVFSPKPTSSEHEVTQGSYFALPLAFLIFIVVTNYTRILPLANRAFELLTSVASPGAIANRSHEEVISGSAPLMNASSSVQQDTVAAIAAKKKMKTRKVQ